MEWILNNKLLIIGGFIVFVGIIDRFATATPEDFKLFGIPIGKYDNEVAKFFTYLKQAIFPGK
jgi:hypothetical protein